MQLRAKEVKQNLLPSIPGLLELHMALGAHQLLEKKEHSSAKWILRVQKEFWVLCVVCMCAHCDKVSTDRYKSGGEQLYQP